MKDLLPYFGLISTFVLVCGLLKFYIYYKIFNISILRFIEIGEIVVLFMDNLMGYMSVTIPATVSSLFVLLNIKDKIYNSNFPIIPLLYGQWKTIGFFIIVLVCVFIFYFTFIRGINRLDFVLIIIFMLAGIIVLPGLLIFTARKFRLDYPGLVSLRQIYFTFLSTLLVLFSVLAAFLEARKVRKNQFFYKVKVTFEDGVSMESGEIQYFIGMTKNYVFMYDKSLNKCSAYKTASVKTITF